MKFVLYTVEVYLSMAVQPGVDLNVFAGDLQMHTSDLFTLDILTDD